MFEPRKFGKPRTYQLDGGFEVLIAGAEDSLEQEFWPVFDGNELHIYTGDAAIERRAQKQQGIAAPVATSAIAPIRAFPAAVQTSAPGPAVDGKEPVFGATGPGGYDGRGPRPKPVDAEQNAFDELGLAGINVNEIKKSVAGGAQLAATPEEVVAP